REAGAFARSARLEQENGGVAAVQQAACDHATRRPGADDHVVITAGERLAAPGFRMMLYHSRTLPEEDSTRRSAASATGDSRLPRSWPAGRRTAEGWSL